MSEPDKSKDEKPIKEKDSDWTGWEKLFLTACVLASGVVGFIFFRDIFDSETTTILWMGAWAFAGLAVIGIARWLSRQRRVK
jgi:uncharacterized protein YegJ (DUF2314 family)